ncbi:MAG: energy-coupling factor transporter transmembrane protein EcfT [Lachnospiraceae bacterium]|nr:energy-coupling factor transporter transmembrane protein EcfT [Lachnospiraceae bacterium]
MLRDITLGQYYNTKSVIHDLDPRTKILGTMVYMVSLFAFNSFWTYLIAFAALCTVIVLSKVPVRFMLRGMKAIFLFLIITVLYNLFLTQGDTIFSFWIFNVTIQGLKQAILMFFRLTFLVVGTSILTLTTTPSNLTDGLESLMHPLKWVKIPVAEIAMMMSIALRFIPVLTEETDKIMRAQKARGADFDNKNLFKRIKSYVPILVPLFISAFRRANDLATAMEARAYRGGDGRTKMKPLKYKAGDWIAYTSMLIYGIAALAITLLINFQTFMLKA